MFSILCLACFIAEVGIRCAVRAILNFTDGVTCYMDEGFTEPCATIWIYNSFETRVKCPMCTDHAFSGAPNNGPPPTCQLAECLQCDEDIGKNNGGYSRMMIGTICCHSYALRVSWTKLQKIRRSNSSRIWSAFCYCPAL